MIDTVTPVLHLGATVLVAVVGVVGLTRAVRREARRADPDSTRTDPADTGELSIHDLAQRRAAERRGDVDRG